MTFLSLPGAKACRQQHRSRQEIGIHVQRRISKSLYGVKVYRLKK